MSVVEKCYVVSIFFSNIDKCSKSRIFARRFAASSLR